MVHRSRTPFSLGHAVEFISEERSPSSAKKGRAALVQRTAFSPHPVPARVRRVCRLMALRRKDWPPPGALFAAAAHDLLDPEQVGEIDAAPPPLIPPTPPACSERLAAAAATSRLLAAYLLGDSDPTRPTVPPVPARTVPASTRDDDGVVAPPRPGGATRVEKPKWAPDERSGGGNGGSGNDGSGNGVGGVQHAARSAKKARRADR